MEKKYAMNKFYPFIFSLMFSIATSATSQEKQSDVRTVFPNGFKVVVSQRHTTPLAALDLWVRAGAREETAQESGAAHFLEHVLFKGSTKYSSGEVDYIIERLGGTLNAATGPDFAHFYTTVPSAHLNEALALLADVVLHATLPKEEIEKERAVILDELELHQSDSSALIADQLYAAAYIRHPYRKSYGGTAEEISACKRDSLLRFYERNYLPSHCVLTIAGDVSSDTAVSAARTYFGDWKSDATASPVHKAIPASEPFLQQGAIITGQSIDRFPRLGIGYLCPAASEKMTSCTAKLVEALLGNSDSYGRLNRTELSGTKTEIRTSPRLDSSLFIVLAKVGSIESDEQVSPAVTLGKLTALRSNLMNAIDSLKSDPPSTDELDSAKVRVLTQLQHDTETDSGLARNIGFAEISGGISISEFKREILGLNSGDIRRYAARFLSSNQCIQIQLLPTKTPGRKQRAR